MRTIVGTKWRHKKRGSEYTIIAIAQGQCSSESIGMYLGIENEEFVVYQNNHGTWVRPIDEFLDGRFEEV